MYELLCKCERVFAFGVLALAIPTVDYHHLNLKSITSPSATTYALPSDRTSPFSLHRDTLPCSSYPKRFRTQSMDEAMHNVFEYRGK